LHYHTELYLENIGWVGGRKDVHAHPPTSYKRHTHCTKCFIRYSLHSSSKQDWSVPPKTHLTHLYSQMDAPNIVKLLPIRLSLPVSSASVERSFSAMKNYIKTRLRNR